MPAIESHPLRIARLSAGLSAQSLADELGLSRGLVTAIEEGRVKSVRREYIALLAERNDMAPARLEQFYANWRARFDERSSDITTRLSPRARAVLQLSPELVSRYPSFAAWRREFSKSTAGFASLLMVSATSLARYERGESTTLPKALVRAFTRTLGMSPEYLQAVMELPVLYQAPVTTRSRRRKREAPDAAQTLQRAHELAAAAPAAQDHRHPGGAVGVTP